MIKSLSCFSRIGFACLIGFSVFQAVGHISCLGIGKHLFLQVLFLTDSRFNRLQLGGAAVKVRIGRHKGCVQFLRGKAVLLHSGNGSRHLFEIVDSRPTVIADALFPRLALLPGQPCAERCCLPGWFLQLFSPCNGFLTAAGYSGMALGLFGGSVGVLREQGKDSRLVKIVPQLPGCDRLCPVRREVGKPPPALLDGHALPQQKGRKLVKAASLGKCLPYRPAQLRLVRFKLGGLGRLSGGFSGGVLFIKGKLPFLCRPVFPFRYPFLAAVQEVDLVKPLPVAHLHDFTLEIFHSGVGAAVLAALPCAAGLSM